MSINRIEIDKESTSPVLDEKFTIYIEKENADKYVSLLKKTWPSIKIKRVA